MNDKLYVRILQVDSVDDCGSIIEEDKTLREYTPYPYKAVHVPNSFSHNEHEVVSLLQNSWWDAVFILGVRDQASTFERILHEQGKNLLGLRISWIPKFVVSAYSPEYLSKRFVDYNASDQRIYHARNITFWQRWKALARSSGLLQYRCPYGYALEPQVDGTVSTYPVEFVRSLEFDGHLRGPNISVLPRRLFDEVEVIRAFTAILKEGPNPEAKLHRFLHEHPQLLYGCEYEAHFSELYQKWLLEEDGKYQRLDFLLVPKKLLPSVPPMILEIKQDIPRVIEGANHAGFVHKVCQAVNQVRDYKRLYQEEKHRRYFQRRTGVALVEPRLAVLIGRFPDKQLLPTYINRKAEILDVEIVTYDELIMNRKAVLAVTAPEIERFF